MREILDAVARGAMAPEEAERRIREAFIGWYEGEVSRFDAFRKVRTGVQEVILAEGKTPAQVAEVVAGAVGSGTVLVSRCDEAARDAVERTLPDGAKARWEAAARMLVISRGNEPTPAGGGRVGILAAGTSDIGPAEEARVVAEAMGCEVRAFYDVGVAGLHRLFGPLRDLVGWPAHALVVAAGREGTLPTVVAGLVSQPVVGLPVSVGYGEAGAGRSALHAMLQSCSPLAVVNIDAGVVAGAVAARIATLAARSLEEEG